MSTSRSVPFRRAPSVGVPIAVAAATIMTGAVSASAEPVADPTPVTVSAVQDTAHDRVLVFGRDRHDQIRYAPPTLGAGWRTVPGRRLASGPSAVLDADGLIAVFARKPDGTLAYTKEIEPGAWSRWRSLGGQIVGAPRAVYLPARQQIVIVGRSPGHTVVLMTLRSGSPSAWHSLSVSTSSGSVSIQATPDVSAVGGTNLALGLLGESGERWLATVDVAAVPTSLYAFAQRTTGGMASAYAGDDRGQDVLWGRGSNGNLSYQAPWKYPNATISITSVPTKWTVTDPNADAVCARGADDALWCNLAITGDGSWFKVGGQLR